MNDKTILVTGGAGFIGSNLCRFLLDKKYNVICLDNLYTGSKENIKELLSNDKFKFVFQDVTSSFDYYVDEIYNLACPASPVHYQKDPIYTMNTNIIGAINVLELAYKYNAKVLQASTSEIYGDPLIHPQREDYWGNVNPIGIRSCYDEGKRCAEALFFDYERFKNSRIKVIRIFNTYGPMMNKEDGRVVSNFILQAIKNEDITIYGDGYQTRSFCYIDDLILGITKMMAMPDSFIGPVNLGNPNEITVLELAEKIISLSKSKSKIIFKKLPQDDPKRRKPDISLAKEKLYWEPKILLEDGIIKTINFFKESKN